MCFIVHIGSLFQPPGPKRRFLGPNPFQRGPFLVGSSFDRNIGMWGVQIVATEFSDDFRQLQLILNHPVGETVQKHHFGGPLEAKNALLGSLVAQKRLNTRPKCVVTIVPAQSDQSVAVGTKSGPRGPSEDLWDPQKRHLEPKRALLGSLVAQKRPDTKPKCVVTIVPALSDQSVAVGTKSGLSGAFRSFSSS